MNKFGRILLVLIFTFCLVRSGIGQINEGDLYGETAQTILPIAGYTSDYGLFGGLLYQRINYRDDFYPFYSNLQADFNGSTRGRWIVGVDYERATLFDRKIRNLTVFEYEREPQSTYFGVGNNSPFSPEAFDDGEYFLLKSHVEFNFDARKTFKEFGNSAVDGVLRLKGSYTSTSDRGRDTQFILNPPPGIEGGWVNKLGTGLIYDSRDSEFSPRMGVRFETGANISSTLMGSDYSFTDGFADLRGYVPLLWDFILAQRVEYSFSNGDVPFWEMPKIGNQRSLRGYALNRFIGDQSVVYMAEVRKWFLSVLDDEIRFGGHFFSDMGRVFSNDDNPRFFDDWKTTWGIGGAVSAFSPDLIVRGEVGFSDEDYRIYAGVGFAF